MNQSGRKIAYQYGENLPAFSTPEEAQRYWTAYRQQHLAHLLEIAKYSPLFKPDFTPESLILLEQWNFEIQASHSYSSLNTTQEEIESSMAVYFGETAVRNSHAYWIVEEYFLAPGRYDLGVRKDTITLMFSHLVDLLHPLSNAPHQSLFREYKKYFARTTPADLDRELIRLVRQKKMISAISLYQQHERCSLAEARKHIESLKTN